MAKQTFADKPNMARDVTISGLKILEVPKGWTFKVVVEFDDKAWKEIQKDPLVQQEMNDTALKAYEQTCTAIKSKYTAFEKLIQGMIDKGAPKDMIMKQIAGLNDSLEKDRHYGMLGAKLAVEQLWPKLCAKRKEYTKYKIKIVVTITGAAAGLATSIGLMAATPFSGGLSAAASIIGMVKSVVTLAKEIGSACLEVEQSIKNLRKYIAATKALAPNLAKAKANEYTAAVLNKFFGLAQPNIKDCDSQIGTITQKLNGLEIKAHDMSIKLNQLLEKQEEMRVQFMKQVQEKLGKHPSKLAPSHIKLIEGRLDDIIAKNTVAVMDAIEKVNVLYTRFKGAEPHVAALQKQVDVLKKYRGFDNIFLENVLYFLDLPLGALSGNTWASKATDLVNGLVPVATSMAFDKVTSVALGGTLLSLSA
jgi:hypothetical protein